MKLTRQAMILELVRTERVPSQEVLRELLSTRGFDVAQATLSRDIRELGLVKVPDEKGGSAYAIPNAASEPAPVLARLLPALYLGGDGVGNLVVLKTVAGGAQPLGAAVDGEHWPEVVGTVAGDDSILLVLREGEQRDTVLARLKGLAERNTSVARSA